MQQSDMNRHLNRGHNRCNVQVGMQRRSRCISSTPRMLTQMKSLSNTRRKEVVAHVAFELGRL